ncbi:hypothetical protein F9B85_07680 [Heliorestis acidaminivorans]|uniref:Uncharacterized protein n=1 Tax=Heliorestis acidaminivorans TaxID=553427 RepID=A0A6I0F2G2_9FIRM|nr:hypothetical protein [Heliorestis acidaminivorans]KAB2952538.1 hypothetical protein F9B85_07680 [Heliorestis acidaminivorans]
MTRPIEEKNLQSIAPEEYRKIQEVVEDVETKVIVLEKQMEVLARHMVRVGEKLDLLLKTSDK